MIVAVVGLLLVGCGEASRRVDETEGYYTGRAIDFLREYGKVYSLFDQFFEADDHLQYPAESRDHKILEKTRDYAAYTRWGPYVNDGEGSIFLNYSEVYDVATINAQHHIEPPNDAFYIQQNNRFRYYDDCCDRFLSLSLPDGDAWDDRHHNDHIHMIGSWNTHFNESTERETDKYPVVLVQFREPLERRVECHTFRMHENVHYSCDIPAIVHEELHKQAKTGVPPEKQELVFDLLNDRFEVVVKGVHQPRLHPLDRRHFDVVAHTMVDNLHDPMLSEWIVYNVLMGVEHFYIYDNTKPLFGPYAIENSALRPFLDANIVTLVYFPYIIQEFVHWNRIQSMSFLDYFDVFGGYAKWGMFADVDEYFLPSVHSMKLLFEAKANATRDGTLSSAKAEALPYFPLLLDHTLARHDTMPGDHFSIMVDSQEMTCDDFENRYGNNVSTRVAVTTHCQRIGKRFNQRFNGHGKVFVKVEINRGLGSPHVGYKPVETEGRLGLFHHFDSLKYSKSEEDKEAYNRPVKSLPMSAGLQQHTYSLLRSIGVDRAP